LTGIEGGQKTANFHQKQSKKTKKILKSTKNDQKKRLKNDQKNTILNGKIEKSSKIDQKVIKMSENQEKVTKMSDQISHKELTPSKCLPWEWTMVGKSGQKRALSLRYPSRN